MIMGWLASFIILVFFYGSLVIILEAGYSVLINFRRILGVWTSILCYAKMYAPKGWFGISDLPDCFDTLTM